MRVRMEAPWFKDEATLLKELRTDLVKGLSKEDAQDRFKIYGSNVLRVQEKTPAPSFFYDTCR